MFALVVSCWLVCAGALVSYVLLARRRRGALAREMHELRGALTSARLAVDMLPSYGGPQLSMQRAACDELDRSSATLSDVDRLLHARLLAPVVVRSRRHDEIDAYAELRRLALIWNGAAVPLGRSLRFEWVGPTEGVVLGGRRKDFVAASSNLLSNALRHGEGVIDLHVSVRSDSLRIVVTDQGPGLPGPLKQLMRRVPIGRHGHGLPVARRAARELGGSLRSAPSTGGARLVLTIPALHNPAGLRAVPGRSGLAPVKP